MATINQFLYNKPLIFDTTGAGADVASPQADFPVIVHINTTSWSDQGERDKFFDTNTLGKRIQFFDSDRVTNLDYEVLLFDNTQGSEEAIYWVRVPEVAGNSDTDGILVAYGSDPNGSDQDNPTGVWKTASGPKFRLVNHMSDAPVLSSYSPVAHTQTGESILSAFIYDGQRYIAVNDWASAAEPLRIYEADADWVRGNLIATSDYDTEEVTGAIFDVMGDKVIFAGRTNNIASIATYDIGGDNWVLDTSSNAKWIGGMVYDPVTELFYISASLVNEDHVWFNKVLISTVANITDMSSWTTETMPEWLGPDTTEFGPAKQYAMTSMTLFKGDLYVLQYDPASFYWRLLKWDLDSTWTEIFISTDTSTAHVGLMLPLFGSSDDLIAVGVPYNWGLLSDMFPDYWQVKYSTNGTDWTTIGNFQMPVGEATYENKITVVPIGNHSIFVSMVSEGKTTGWHAIFNVATHKMTYYQAGIKSSFGNTTPKLIFDGDNIILDTAQDQKSSNAILHYLDYEPSPVAGNGTQVPDSTSYLNHGTKLLLNEPNKVEGLVGYAQDFDGNNDKVDVLHDLNAIFTGDFSMSAILQMGDTGTRMSAFTVGYYLDIVFTLRRTTGNKLQPLLDEGPDTDYDFYTTSTSFTLSATKYHIFVTYNRGTRTFKVYVDGVENGQATTHFGDTPAGSTTVGGVIGAMLIQGTGAIDEWNGIIDEVRVYADDMTADWAKLEYYSMKKTDWNGDAWLSWGEEVERTRRILISHI